MTLRRTALAVLAALALLVAGCGSDSENKGDPIPASNVTELQKQLDAIEARFNHGDGACADITNDSEPAVSRALDQIPSSVDRKVRDSLRQSFERLFRLTSEQCDTTPTETETETETTPTQPPTETQETQTQQTETQQTETQQTQPQPTPPGQQKPKKQKGPKGNGNGGGGAPAPQD